MSFKCYYCKNSTILIKTGVDPTSWAHPRRCEKCGVDHWITRHGQFLYLTWSSVLINNNKYLLKLYPKLNNPGAQCILYKMVMKVNGLPSWQEVKRFDFLPDWKPLSAPQKIKTLLTFL